MFRHYFKIVLTTGLVVLLFLSVTSLSAKKERLKVIDYRKHLNKKFIQVPRTSTRYIIIHTSEAGLSSTLNSLSRGKSVGRYRTVGGHSHYAIARNGQVYRILSHVFRADHAGLSMWDGIEDLSSCSVGIELVGYHYDTITDEQYHSLSSLLTTLQKVYDISDKDVLTHSQISYGNPNIWFKRLHRGRKRCALNFDREKVGLKDAWTYDPDVRAGRLAQDPHIFAMFYKGASRSASKRDVVPDIDITEPIQTSSSAQNPAQTPSADEDIAISNVISLDNTAWNIAGEDYDDTTTLYVLPGGNQVRGDQLGQLVGWDSIPVGTRVLLNQPQNIEKKIGPVLLLTPEYTAWSFAQSAYNKSTTIYFLPDGRVIPGNLMADWDAISSGSQMIIGYNGPFNIEAVKGKTPWGLAGAAHNSPDTVYYIPGLGVLTGEKVKSFSGLPKGSLLFLPIGN